MSRTQITKSLDLKATAYQCAALFVITITAAIAHAGDQEPPQDVPVRVPDNYDPAVPAPPADHVAWLLKHNGRRDGKLAATVACGKREWFSLRNAYGQL